MAADDPIEHLIGLLSRLPGLGRRSARRAVLKMLMRPEQQMLPLAEALQAAAEAVAKVLDAPVEPRIPEIAEQPPGVIVLVTG